MNEILDNIIAEIIESDISAYDFKVVNEIIEKYRYKDTEQKDALR